MCFLEIGHKKLLWIVFIVQRRCPHFCWDMEDVLQTDTYWKKHIQTCSHYYVPSGNLPLKCQVVNCPIWYTAKFTLKWRGHSYHLGCVSGYYDIKTPFLKFYCEILFTMSQVQCKKKYLGTVEVIFIVPSQYKLKYSSKCFNFQNFEIIHNS